MQDQISILEEKVKWLKRIMAGLFVLIVISALVPAKGVDSIRFTNQREPTNPDETITAGDIVVDTLTVETIQIVDSQGNVTGRFGYSQDEDLTQFVLFDSDGDLSLAIDAYEIGFFDGGENPSVGIDGSGIGVNNNQSGSKALLGREDDADGGEVFLSVGKEDGSRAGIFWDGTTDSTVIATFDETGVTWTSDQSAAHIKHQPGAALLGDLNNDNKVDFADFIIFAQNFGN